MSRFPIEFSERFMLLVRCVLLPEEQIGQAEMVVHLRQSRAEAQDALKGGHGVGEHIGLVVTSLDRSRNQAIPRPCWARTLPGLISAARSKARAALR